MDRRASCGGGGGRGAESGRAGAPRGPLRQRPAGRRQAAILALRPPSARPAGPSCRPPAHLPNSSNSCPWDVALCVSAALARVLPAEAAAAGGTFAGVLRAAHAAIVSGDSAAAQAAREEFFKLVRARARAAAPCFCYLALPPPLARLLSPAHARLLRRCAEPARGCSAHQRPAPSPPPLRRARSSSTSSLGRSWTRGGWWSPSCAAATGVGGVARIRAPSAATRTPQPPPPTPAPGMPAGQRAVPWRGHRGAKPGHAAGARRHWPRAVQGGRAGAARVGPGIPLLARAASAPWSPCTAACNPLLMPIPSLWFPTAARARGHPHQGPAGAPLAARGPLRAGARRLQALPARARPRPQQRRRRVLRADGGAPPLPRAG
jgi:hypothetical protein